MVMLLSYSRGQVHVRFVGSAFDYHLRPQRSTMREIATKIAEEHGFTLSEIRARTNRYSGVRAHARDAAMHGCYALGAFSNGQIGNFFDVHYTTIIDARQRHEARLASKSIAQEPAHAVAT